mmetsp:Transcript_11181/g.24196  ORF Transcript_11181/g.24196 Transcript_11181/m.24196 type:complete len:206 (-) Transcript_11181:993-1610(-)
MSSPSATTGCCCFFPFLALAPLPPLAAPFPGKIGGETRFSISAVFAVSKEISICSTSLGLPTLGTLSTVRESSSSSRPPRRSPREPPTLLSSSLSPRVVLPSLLLERLSSSSLSSMDCRDFDERDLYELLPVSTVPSSVLWSLCPLRGLTGHCADWRRSILALRALVLGVGPPGFSWGNSTTWARTFIMFGDLTIMGRASAVLAR